MLLFFDFIFFSFNSFFFLQFVNFSNFFLLNFRCLQLVNLVSVDSRRFLNFSFFFGGNFVVVFFS